jgi:CDP-diacylglycerol---serine O-phosphatidyltransferase
MTNLDKSRYLLPNMFTSMNFLLGVWAIILATDTVMVRGDNLNLAAWFIVYCVLFDKLDGFTARIMKASSEFGAQFDSLADLVAFGLAPALLLLFSYNSMNQQWFNTHKFLVFVGISLYVLCAALRLARYNAIDSAEGETDYFVGLPSTFAGAINVVVVLLYLKYDLFSEPGFLERFPILVMIATAFLMISPLTLPKLKKRKSKIINIIQLICIIFVYITGLAMVYPEITAVLMLIYFSVGLLHSNLIARPRANH